MSNMRMLKRRPLRRDRGDAFFPDPASGTFVSLLPDAEEFIASITAADSVVEEARNELSVDELGVPLFEDEELEAYDD